MQFSNVKNIIFDYDCEEVNEALSQNLNSRLNSSTFIINTHSKEPTLLTAASLGDLKRIEVGFF